MFGGHLHHLSKLSQPQHFGHAMRPEMIAQIIWKHFSCVLDVIPRKMFVCNWRSQKYLLEAAYGHKIIPARQPCVTRIFIPKYIVGPIVNPLNLKSCLRLTK